MYINQIKIDKPYKLDELDDNIETAQIILDGLGYNLDRKDGYFDNDTVAALKEFQSEHSLSETGEVDEERASAVELRSIKQRREGKGNVQTEAALAPK